MKKLMLLLALVVLLVSCAPVAQEDSEELNITVDDVDDAGSEETEESDEEAEASEEEAEAEESSEEVNLQDIPKKEILEGELVEFPNLRAVDPDGDPIHYTFTSPLDENGKWQTELGDEGEYVVTITASDGLNTVGQEVLIVVKPRNKPPVVELEESSLKVEEGETVEIVFTAEDPEGEDVTVTFSGWMTSSTKEVGFDDEGLHEVVITVTDGQLTTAKEIMIDVQNVNRAPELTAVEDITIKEGEKVTVRPHARDPDGDSVSFSYDDYLDEKGSWATELGDAGEYDIIVTASDGDLTSEETFTLIVEAVNRPPVVELESPVMAEEGKTVTLEPTITDKEGDEVRVTYSGWMTSNTKRVGYDEAGDHVVVITARDTAGNEARLEVTVSVEEVNRAPVFGSGSFN